MTLADLGAVGELIGSLGVIISLLYLSIQIRQNTQSVQATSYQTVVDGVNQVNRLLIAEEELPRLVLAGQRDLSALSPEDRVRFGAFLGHLVTNHEIALHLHTRGLLDADSFDAHRASVARVLAPPGARRWWELSRGAMSRALREHLDAELAARPEALPP